MFGINELINILFSSLNRECFTVHCQIWDFSFNGSLYQHCSNCTFNGTVFVWSNSGIQCPVRLQRDWSSAYIPWGSCNSYTIVLQWQVWENLNMEWVNLHEISSCLKYWVYFPNTWRHKNDLKIFFQLTVLRATPGHMGVCMGFGRKSGISCIMWAANSL